MLGLIVSVLLKELIEKVSLPGFRESVFLGVAEAQELGKEFLGITLSNGDGIILKVNPYEDILLSMFLMTKEKRENLKFIALFKNTEDTTYFIYEINNYEEFLNSLLTNISIVYVEVISGDLEDFLHRAEDG
ncbi:hypothetical protein [Sulfuracidifex metallicus]|uniref:hypothetical protein n=1 Tax=Sulfuracidifex metallicus TaxID=47303 RepID=UPI002274E65F|nr:hypothetical protein [Sulfuracidifex metallicus]MCY0849588.1 hypothetical protein [Sulfuracidifex metallicus]